MKHNRLYLLGTSLVVMTAGFWAAGQDKPQAAKPLAPQKAEAQKADPEQADSGTADRSTSDRVDTNLPKSAETAETDAIVKTAESYLKAYRDGDAKAAAAHFTVDAEYVDENGNTHIGRKAIEQVLADCFAKNPTRDIELEIDSIKFVSPGVALEDGHLTVLSDDESEPASTTYSAVHVKHDGKWLVASVRERAPKDRRQHRSQLEQLAWLQGDWMDEDLDSTVYFSCGAIDNGNFLLREFAIQINGEHAMSGSQRIGWDPLSGKLRTWIFDSEGGFAEGFWFRDDDRWLLKAVGITADGEMASSTSIYKVINDHMMTWQSVDHEVGGIRLADSDVITIVRRAPDPRSREQDEADSAESESDSKSKTESSKPKTGSKPAPDKSEESKSKNPPAAPSKAK